MIPVRNLPRLIKKAIGDPGYALRAFGQRSRSYLSYHLRRGYSAYPETISLFLTFRCNLRCKMCAQWGECGTSSVQTADTLKQELSLEEIKGVINDVRSFRPTITLFGGEPFLYHDWREVVKCAKAAGLRCNAVTNGTLLEGKAADVIGVGLDEIIVSLEGDCRVHDEVTQVKGSFDRVMKGFTEINTLKKKKNIETPHVSICSTITEDNYRALEKVIEIGERIGADGVTFHHPSFISQDVYAQHNRIFSSYFGAGSSDWAGFVRNRLPLIEVDLLLKKMRLIKMSPHNIDVFFYPNFSDEEVGKYYTDFNFSSDTYKRRCLSPWMVVYIFPDGSVRPCEELGFSTGNIKERSFKGIWNNDSYRHFRRVVKGEKVFPVCSKCTELYRF